MPVLWRKEMSIHNVLLDADHRYLICMINTVELALRNQDSGRESLEMALQQLHEYTQEHFSREEIIQLKIKYPHYVEHKQEHQRLMEQLDQLREDILQHDSADDQKRDTDQLILLLRNWLIDHVLKADMTLKVFLEKYPSNFA